MQFLKYIFLLSLILLLATSCDSPKHAAGKSHLVTANLSESVSHLYYNGSIEPLNKKNLISHIDGIVYRTYVAYGDWVQANQKLATIRSVKAQHDYEKELADYVKSKDQYLRAKESFAATTTLYRAGIVSKESYLSEKSQLEGYELSYVVAATTLKNKYAFMIGDSQDIENLTLANIDDLRKVLEKKYIEFDVYSPISGILLAPVKGGDSSAGGEGDKKIVEGGEIKENQTLFTVGDMTGISTRIEANEAQINAIQNDQAVTITSWALPGVVLPGKVSHVARQASASNASQGTASFNVEIVVPNITEVQRKLIRVGMTIKVDIAVRHPPAIRLPLKAVTQQNGASHVTLVDAKTRQQRLVPVTTGDTDLKQVVITSGIKPGDTVMVRDD
jgi:multidrug efflux pump subunit AcrA (membrane-fusion protein)